MDLSELLSAAVAGLSAAGIDYLVTGSVASTLYGEPRFTNDIDIAVRLTAAEASRLAAAFPEPDFYVSVEAAQEAVRRRGQFNVIHPASGLKIDFMVVGNDAFNQSRFERGRLLDVLDAGSMRVAAPEDVILRKLEYFREGRSEKHLRDIRGILLLQGDRLDLKYIEEWVKRLGVEDEWSRAQQ